jgi:peptidoglycan hydrolase CwlO-like protein
MSELNYPTATDTQYSAPSPKKEGNGKNIIIALLAAGLIGSGYFIWSSQKEEKAKDQKQDEALAQQSQKTNDVEGLYQAALARLDSVSVQGAEKDAQIAERNGTINNLKAEISGLLAEKSRNGKLTAQQEATLRAKIDALNREIDGFKARIQELEQANKVLTEENTVVKTERDQVKSELSTTQENLAKTTDEKKALENTVDVGATLSASGFAIAGINEKRGGKEKETSTAKRVDKLRISFGLDANRITTSGKKEVFVCITSPDGQPVTVEALGSGRFRTREDGDKFYTNKIDVDYVQGQKKFISFDWKQNSDFQRGDYKVEVYQNGFKIGEGKVTLKKGGLFG